MNNDKVLELAREIGESVYLGELEIKGKQRLLAFAQALTLHREEAVAMKCQMASQDGKTPPVVWLKSYNDIPEGTYLYAAPAPVTPVGDESEKP